jgi:hypothetical protein
MNSTAEGMKMETSLYLAGIIDNILIDRRQSNKQRQ